MKYPFEPKSTVKLQLGDYWCVQRRDGQFGYFSFLYPFSGRTSFIVALLKDAGSTELIMAQRVEIHAVGMTVIRTFAATGSRIVGNIAEKLDLAECEAWRDEFETRSTVWGYQMLSELVNEVPNKALQATAARAGS